MATSDDESAEELLLAAVNVLPAEQRERVLSWLQGHLDQWATDRGLVQGPIQTTTLEPGELAQNLVLLDAGAVLGDEQQVMPLRLSSDEHAALREWCQRHGFSMATVVRSLVAQFIDAR